jgi:hypothetical protein
LRSAYAAIRRHRFKPPNQTYGPMDIVAFLDLEKSSFGWKVLNLQARGGVPDASEVAQLWKNCIATFFKIVGYLLLF